MEKEEKGDDEEKREEEGREKVKKEETGEPSAKRGKMGVEEEAPSFSSYSLPSSSQFVSYDPSTMRIDRETLPSILGIRGSPTEVLLRMHQISVNSPDRFVQMRSSVEESIKKAIQDSYWKLLSQDFEKTPPVFTTAISLVHEIKEMLLNGLVPQKNEKMRREVIARLDLNTLKNQTEQGELDVFSIVSFILSVFSSICAPHRDPEIAEIRSTMEEGQVPALLRNLMEMTDKIKEDVISFKLEMRRKEVIQAARDYERHDLVSSFAVVKGGKEKLDKWIRELYERTKEEGDSLEGMDEIVRRTVIRGFIENVSFPSISAIPFHWRLDLAELAAFSLERRRIILVAASLYLLSAIHPGVAESNLTDRLTTLLADLTQDNLDEILPTIYIECEKVMRDANTLNEETEKKLAVIKQFNQKDQPLIAVAGRRVDEYLWTVLHSSSSSLPPPPSLLLPLSPLFAPLKKAMLPFINHNEITFKQLYIQVLSTLLPSP